MNVMLFDDSTPTSPVLLERVKRRIAHALRLGARRVRDVQVWITDLNGSKGGIDKRCRIVAHIDRSVPIVVESRESDYYRAVDGASAKLQRAAARRFRA